MFNEYKEYLREAAQMYLHVDLTPRQLEQFSQYGDLLLEWNEKINLTRIVDPKEIVVKHFIDSLTLAKYVKGKSLVDIGTGAGFPGLPLKILNPEWEVVLVDSLGKRVKFLEAVVQDLRLSAVETVHARAEDIGRMKNYREKFDTATSRAVAGFSVLLEYALPLLKNGGCFLAPKGQKIDEEIKGAEGALLLLNGKISRVETFSLGDEAEHRAIVVVEKIKTMSDKYPRKAGLPAKAPL